MVGKPIEEIRLRKLMKQKLQTTSIPALEFEDHDGTTYKFEDLYDYHKFLGAGSFGFVVSAIDRKTGEHVALKVKDLNSLNYR
jgi:serine/threonine protein kinase